MFSVLFKDLLLRGGEVRLNDVWTEHVKANMMQNFKINATNNVFFLTLFMKLMKNFKQTLKNTRLLYFVF